MPPTGPRSPRAAPECVLAQAVLLEAPRVGGWGKGLKLLCLEKSRCCVLLGTGAVRMGGAQLRARIPESLAITAGLAGQCGQGLTPDHGAGVGEGQTKHPAFSVGVGKGHLCQGRAFCRHQLTHQLSFQG